MTILDLFFPKHCLGCQKPGRYFCPQCLPTIKKVPQICPVCERPSPFGQTHYYCTTRYTLDGLISFFAYEGIIRKAIHKLKYRYVTDLMNEFLKIIFQEFKNRPDELLLFNRFCRENNPTIVPIPLFWYKENERGFNQSSLFGKKLAYRLNLPYSDRILIRKKMTVSQTKLSPKERLKNVAEAFSIAPRIAIASYYYLILLDDIWTTGATLKTAGNVLKREGIKKVWGLTLAK